jgi:cytoskeletal protein CcmA (bactofilin family)
MFGSKKIKSAKIDTLVGQGVEVNGDIKFQGGLHLDGVVNGNVTTVDNAEGTVLVISDQGCVKGDVYVAYAVINGEVVGNVYASEKLELSANARISGNVEYNLLEMASGAEINGQMFHNAKTKRVMEPKKQDSKTDSKDNIHHLEDTVIAKG